MKTSIRKLRFVCYRNGLCMSLGTSETEAMHIIDEAIDLGINF